MKLKTATLIALVGVGAVYALKLSTVIPHLENSETAVFGLRDAVFTIPLLIFLFVLYRKQQ